VSPSISLADLIRATIDLEVRGDETRRAVLRLLGLSGELGSPVPPALDVWIASSPESPAAAAEPLRDLTSGDVAPAGPPAAPSAASSGATRRARLTHVKSGPQTVAPPAWVGSSAPLPAVAVTRADPPPEPLFGRRTQRAILSALVATYVDEGEIDVDRILETIGEGRPFLRLPRTTVPTLRRGAQVLVDRGPGMDPYRGDQAGLLTQLNHVLADDRFEVIDFAGCPSRGAGRGSRARWRAYRLPPAATPIVLLSDLGIGGPPLEVGASEAEWLAFARFVRGAGHPVIALVPYQARRWPASAARTMTLVHWSERTTARAVRQALRRASARR
jgi:hypothetical protein